MRIGLYITSYRFSRHLDTGIRGDCTGDGSAGNPWLTIQNAVDNVSSGDTIQVAAGTYNEDITITKGLTLTTPSGSPATIDGGIWIKDLQTYTHAITVDHFNIQNGTTFDVNYDYGIKITGDVGYNVGTLNVVDMHIVNNTFVNCG